MKQAKGTIIKEMWTATTPSLPLILMQELLTIWLKISGGSKDLRGRKAKDFEV